MNSPNKNTNYLANPNLKKTGVQVNLTEDQFRQYVKCIKDPVFFIENYVKVITLDEGFVNISLYPFQKEAIDDITNNRLVILKAGRQIGKCVFINTKVRLKNSLTGEIYDTTIGDFYERISRMQTLQQNNVPATFPYKEYSQDENCGVYRKFIESYELKNWEVFSDTGWIPATHLHKTVKYQEWIVRTESGKELICADDHILFDEEHNQIFVKNLRKNISKIQTQTGLERVVEVGVTNKQSHMFDLTVDSPDHRFYTNGILSHNTTMVVGYILWYILFNEDQFVAILANKAPTAREILNRIKIAYEALPIWLQQGVKVWNKGDIELENKCRVMATSTASSAIRGYSINCVTKETKICVLDEKTNSVYYSELSKLLNKSELSEVKTECSKMYYTVYKTTNKINGKIYVGYHQTTDLNDGYLGSGKLIKAAVEKYGVSAFTKEILAIFETKKEAEAYEAALVSKEFTLREDTYNIAVGGNVRIMHGENNPFFGKTHSQETKKHFSAIRKGNFLPGTELISDDITFKSMSEAQKYFDASRSQLIKMAGDPNCSVRFTCRNKQNLAEQKYNQLLESREILSIDCKNRFLGVAKSQEHRQKISIALAGKKKSKEHINKINQNPEKIKKTAKKHKGMKRSLESRNKMSQAKKGTSAKNKGMIYCYNPLTKEKIMCLLQNMPPGWIRGFLPK